MRQTFGRAVIASLVAVLLAASGAFGAASYPTSVKSFVTKVTGDVIQAVHINDLQDEVTAIEQGLLNGLDHTLRPLTTNARDLGTNPFRWRDLFIARLVDISSTGTTEALTAVLGSGATPVNPTQPVARVRAFLTTSAGIAYRGLHGILDVQAGTGGNPLAVHGLTQATATWTAGTDPLIGVQGEATTTRGGDLIGVGALVTNTTLAAGTLQGIEVDIDSRIASTNRFGISIVANATGSAQATGEDAMLRLVNKVGGALWKDGILLTNSPLFPIATTGKIIRAIGAATIDSGIDLSTLTITTNLLAGPGPFQITGTGRVRAAAGAVGTPSYAFENDTDTGMFRSGIDLLSFATAGVERLRIEDNGRVSWVSTGDVTGPAIRLLTDMNTGMFWQAADALAFAIGGNEGLRIAEPADGTVALLVRRNLGGTLSLEQVSMGAADSCGIGSRCLRVPN